MKANISIVLLVSFMIMITGCGSDNDTLSADDLVGKWRCELYGSELVIEFTEDGRFISHTDMSVNYYRVENGKIITYVENVPDSDVSVEAQVNDDKLIFGGVEYTRLNP